MPSRFVLSMCNATWQEQELREKRTMILRVLFSFYDRRNIAWGKVSWLSILTEWRSQKYILQMTCLLFFYNTWSLYLVCVLKTKLCFTDGIYIFIWICVSIEPSESCSVLFAGQTRMVLSRRFSIMWEP